MNLVLAASMAVPTTELAADSPPELPGQWSSAACTVCPVRTGFLQSANRRANDWGLLLMREVDVG